MEERRGAAAHAAVDGDASGPAPELVLVLWLPSVLQAGHVLEVVSGFQTVDLLLQDLLVQAGGGSSMATAAGGVGEDVVHAAGEGGHGLETHLLGGQALSHCCKATGFLLVYLAAASEGADLFCHGIADF